MRKQSVGLLICAGFAAPSIAWADGPALNAHALGTTEAILSYCAKIDPAAAAKYGQQAKALTKGASQEALATLRNGEEYQKAWHSVDDFVAKVDEHNAKRVCSESVAASK